VGFTDLVQGINEWGGNFYSNAQFQSQVIQPAQDQQRRALANAIASVNGQDPSYVYDQLSWEKTVGGNADFRPGKIDLSFLDPEFSLTNSNSFNHYGAFPAIHMHGDGLIHLDTANPLALLPLGALGHLIFDLTLGSINGSVPMPH